MGNGFDFKNCFAPPPLLLGLFLCPWMWHIFFVGIQHSPVDGCSAVSYNFGVLAGEDKHMSFYSTILRAIKMFSMACKAPFFAEEDKNVKEIFHVNVLPGPLISLILGHFPLLLSLKTLHLLDVIYFFDYLTIQNSTFQQHVHDQIRVLGCQVL